MTARTRAATALLLIATFLWALWLGGQFYNATMSVPVWSARPPESMAVFFRQWDEHVRYYFFSLVSPWNFLATWLAWGLAPKGSAAKGMLRWTALFALLNCSLLFWAITLIGSAAGGAVDGTMDTASIIRNIGVWIPLNLANNVALSAAIFTMHLLALRKLEP